jgi:hypothetical protein
MVASGTRHNGAAWRRHGRGLVARRAAMGRRAILRGHYLVSYFHRDRVDGLAAQTTAHSTLEPAFLNYFLYRSQSILLFFFHFFALIASAAATAMHK